MDPATELNPVKVIYPCRQSSITMARPIYLNPSASHWRYTDPSLPPEAQESHSPVLAFHQRLPNYSESPLRTLPSIAAELRLGHVLVKDESRRFGLPSFKILGASWAAYRAVAGKLGLDVFADDQPPLNAMGPRAREKGLNLTIVTCTEGNWGRAVARMGKLMDVPVVVHVPSHMTEATRQLIRDEGAEVVVVEGDYDVSAGVARKRAATAEGALLVMDIGWEGYDAVPQVRVHKELICLLCASYKRGLVC